MNPKEIREALETLALGVIAPEVGPWPEYVLQFGPYKIRTIKHPHFICHRAKRFKAVPLGTPSFREVYRATHWKPNTHRKPYSATFAKALREDMSLPEADRIANHDNYVALYSGSEE